MKYVIIFLFAFTSLSAQDSLQITQAERMIDKYSEKIVGTFNQSIESVTPLAEEGFDMLVKLQMTKGIGGLLPLFFCLLFFYLFSKERKRILSLLNSDSVPSYMDQRRGVFDKDNSSVFLWAYLVLGLLFTIMALVTTYGGLLRLTAPEWYAVKEIINLIS